MSVNIEEIYFAFGPEHSYFFDGPKCREYRGVPSEWDDIGKMQTVKCIAMSDNGVTFRVFEDEEGCLNWATTGNFDKKFKSLAAWMDELDSRTDCRLAFGPDNNYLAWSAHSSETYRTTPDEEEADDVAAEGGRIDIAIFGVDWAYFYLWRDGRWEYNLKGHYRTLSEYLKDLDSGDIEFIALNPYFVEEFFLLLKNNTAIFRVPLSYKENLVSALEQHGISCTDLVSQRATAGGASLPPATKKKGFWKAFGKQAAKGATGAVVSVVAQSLVGSIMCSVM